MDYNSTTEKGNAFENRVFKVLKMLLQNDDFFLPGKTSKIFWKKPYNSKATQNKITIDISIETFLSNAEKYSTLTLIECKSLGRKIGVDDIREFSSKISEIGEHNTKGIFITDNSFQKGAYDLALSKGMGLAKIKSNDELDWISYRKGEEQKSTQEELELQFIDEEIQADNFVSTVNGKQFYNYADILLEIGAIDFFTFKEKFIDVRYVTEKQIEDIVEKIKSYNVYSGDFLEEQKICDFLIDKYLMEFDLSANLPSQILGKISFNPLKIFINSILDNDPHRKRFTLAHEIGHLTLHSKYFKNRIPEKNDSDETLPFKYFASEMTTRRIEFQANLFASSLLMPQSLITKTVTKYFQRENINKGHLYWDHQPINQKLVMLLLTEISTSYKVSIETARIKLISLGLLIDKRFKSIGDIMRELKFG